MNGGVYGCSQRIEGKEGTGPPAECHAVFPGRLQSRLAGRGGFPADMPAGRDRPAPGLLAGTGLGGIRPAGRAAGALPAGGTAQQRHRERGGPYFAGMASAGQKSQGYGQCRPVHRPAFSGRCLGHILAEEAVLTVQKDIKSVGYLCYI